MSSKDLVARGEFSCVTTRPDGGPWFRDAASADEQRSLRRFPVCEWRKVGARTTFAGFRGASWGGAGAPAPRARHPREFCHTIRLDTADPRICPGSRGKTRTLEPRWDAVRRRARTKTPNAAPRDEAPHSA